MTAATGLPTDTSRKPPELRLTQYKWSGLIERHFFDSALTGSIGAGLGILWYFDKPDTFAPWIVDLGLTILCMLLAFLRVWKTIREEHETNAIWAKIEDDSGVAGEDDEGWFDRVMEVPYLICITAMSFSSLLPQAFLILLMVFYWSDNYYNAALVKGIVKHLPRLVKPEADGGDAPEGTGWAVGQVTSRLARVMKRLSVAPLTVALLIQPFRMTGRDRGANIVDDREGLIGYLHERFIWNLVFFALALFAFAVSSIQVFAKVDVLDWHVSSSWIITVVILIILILEWLVEPRRHRSHRFWAGTSPREPVASEG